MKSSRIRRKSDSSRPHPRVLKWSLFDTPGSPVHVADAALTYPEISEVHGHEYFEFFLVRKGAIRHFYKKTFEDAGTRSLRFVPAGMVHWFSCTKKVTSTLITNISFPIKLFRRMAGLITDQAGIDMLNNGFLLSDIPANLFDRMCTLIDRLKPESDLDYTAREVLFKALFFEMVSEMLERTAGRNVHNRPGWLKIACRLMEEDENLENGLARFVKISGKTQEHLTRTMTGQMGLTPTAYINRLRVKKVCKRLRNCNDTVTSIAFEAGFGNLAHFNTVFRRELGVSPREYRKRESVSSVPGTR